jgi:hypothetical protein
MDDHQPTYFTKLKETLNMVTSAHFFTTIHYIILSFQLVGIHPKTFWLFKVRLGQIVEVQKCFSKTNLWSQSGNCPCSKIVLS